MSKIVGEWTLCCITGRECVLPCDVMQSTIFDLQICTKVQLVETHKSRKSCERILACHVWCRF